MNRTTIAIRKETRDQIASLRENDESLEKIIQKLLKKWDENN